MSKVARSKNGSKNAVSKKIPEPLKRLVGCLVITSLGILLVAFSSEEAAPLDVQHALDEGNRLFRNGQFEQAADAYLVGYSPENPNPTLVYNLGTTYHQLGNLPEAILWYQRSQDDDPWRQENLWLARRTLGSQTLDPAGFFGRLFPFTKGLRFGAILLSWLVLIGLVASRKVSRWVPISAASLACGLFLLALATEAWAPRPAVLLEDCFTDRGELPAGTEAWVRPAADGAWAISGTDGMVCETDSAELIFPRS